MRDLVLDAATKSRRHRAKGRLREAHWLHPANAVVEAKQTEADEVEEMMRVAMELSDHDIEFLREFGENRRFHASKGKITSRAYDAHANGSRADGDRIDLRDRHSVFSKLESYGLVARLAPPNNLNLMADFQNRYVLLKKGFRILESPSAAAFFPRTSSVWRT